MVTAIVQPCRRLEPKTPVPQPSTIRRQRPVVEAFVGALEHLPGEHAPQYYEYAYWLTSRSARRILEEIMASTTWPVFSPFAKEHYGKGLKDGKSEGLAEGEAKAVLTVLHARGIPVSDSISERITRCTDLTRLDEWVRRSATVARAEDLFADQA